MLRGICEEWFDHVDGVKGKVMYMMESYCLDGRVNKHSLDPAMVLLIHFLNTHGFETNHCCGGHLMKDTSKWNGSWYVAFNKWDIEILQKVCDRLNDVYFGKFEIRTFNDRSGKIGEVQLRIDPSIKGMNQARLLDLNINVLIAFRDAVYG